MTQPARRERTRVVDPVDPDPAAVAAAARWIADGGIVAFPTETFYGLAVDPRRDTAVEALFDLKGRDARAALPLVAASRAVADRLGPLSGCAARLSERFWPGPLSIVIDAPGWIAAAVHAGTGSVAVRVPSHAVALALAAAAGGLVTATSANRSGEPPAAAAGALESLLADPRLFILDGGPTRGGAPSTIVDARGPEPRLIRNGAVPWEDVRAVCVG